MKKKMRHLYRFLVLFGCLAMGSTTMVGQGTNAFDDLFKGFDFDAFLKDMEKAYDEDAERKAFGPAATKAPGAPTPLGGGEKTIITQTPTTKPQTKEELFLTPITQTIQEKGKPTETLLTHESINAFKEVMHEFITLLDTVTTKVEASRIFSLPFKEQFLPCRDSVDKIAISYGTMVSKKLYATIMPFQQASDLKVAAAKLAVPQGKAPQAKEATTLRQDILNAVKELREINKDLTSVLADEEKETDIEVLKELSKHKHKRVVFEKPATSKRKRAQEPQKQLPKQKEKIAPSKPKAPTSNVIPDQKEKPFKSKAKAIKPPRPLPTEVL